jgi:hypothetical protein
MAGRPKGSKKKKNESSLKKKPDESVPRKAAVPAVVNDVADEDATDWDAVPSDSESEEEVVDVTQHLANDDCDPVNKALHNRMSTAGAFGKSHGCRPDDGWHGKEGTIIQIRKQLWLGRWIDIESVLNEVLRCKMDRARCTGLGKNGRMVDKTDQEPLPDSCRQGCQK